MIDYVLKSTKRKTLRYIGHSMGTTVLIVLLSMKPEYNAKIELGILLAPVALWKDISPVLKSILYKIPNFKVKKYQSHIVNEINIYFIYKSYIN